MLNNKIIVFIGIILATFFWGSNFNVGAIVVKEISPFVIASVRFTIASIIIMFYLVIKSNNNLTILKQYWARYIVLGLIGVSGFNLAFFLGLKSTSAVNGALIVSTSPITTAIFAAILDKHKIKLSQLLGMLISFIGVALIVSHGSIKNLFELNFNYGDLLILFGSLGWAIYSVGTKKYLPNSTSLQTTAFTMLFGTIGILLFTVSQDNLIESVGLITLKNSLLLIYMAIFGSIFAYIFWLAGIQKIGATHSAIFFNLVPVFTMLIALFTGSIPTSLQIIGGFIVIICVIFATESYKVLFKR